MTGLLEASVGRWLRFLIEAVPPRHGHIMPELARDMRQMSTFPRNRQGGILHTRFRIVVLQRLRRRHAVEVGLNAFAVTFGDRFPGTGTC